MKDLQNNISQFIFADVIIDISIEALDRSFQYRIPESLLGKIKIGSSVLIPFGRGNRKISGVVVGISDKAKWDVDKIKEIIEVNEKNISAEERLLQLAAWIKEKYNSTMNEAIRTVLPVKKQIKSINEFWLSFVATKEEIQKKLDKCKLKHYTAKARFLQGMIDEGGQMTSKLAREKYKISKSVIDGFVKDNTIEITDKRIYRTPYLNSIKEEKNQKIIVLNDIQKEICQDFFDEYRAGKRNIYLLYGITGSGKTEVYMNMMDSVLEDGKQVIFLIPEIALTFQMVSRFKERFGERISILNSRMSAGEKFDQYERVRNGQVDIVVGPRSALFMPFERIGLIIIDEEHESSYKSEHNPKYHARDVAIEWAKMNHASLVLGSATPTIDTYKKACEGIYKCYRMRERVGNARLPQIHIVDLREELKRGNYSIFSKILQEKIRDRLEKKEQIMIFLNRRGYAGFVSCRNCGYVVKCEHCDVSMTAHKDYYGNVDTLTCHYCGKSITIPKICPKCGSKYISTFGLGTQKVEESLGKLFPQARILRMDKDTTSGKYGHEAVLGPFRQGKADVLIGTQMIVKGHDIPNVTLVAAISADMGMYTNDFMGNERTFDLLMQASGRAGRGDKRGEVVIQTYNPDEYCIEAVKRQDADYFYENELAFRDLTDYPPYCRILKFLASGINEKMTERLAKEAVDRIKKIKDTYEFKIIGPISAPVKKIKDIYRFQFYIKTKEKNFDSLKDEIEKIIENMKIKSDYGISIDYL